MSDSTVRPSHLPSPKVGYGTIVAPDSYAAAGESAPKLQGPTPSLVSGLA